MLRVMLVLTANKFTDICFVDTQNSGSLGSGEGGRCAPSCKREEVRKLPGLGSFPV